MGTLGRCLPALFWFAAAALSGSGCTAIQSFWGEKAPEKQVAVLEAKPLPGIELLLSDDEPTSLAAWKEWKTELQRLFDQVNGNTKGRLTTDEIITLARLGYLRLSDDTETTVSQIRSALWLMGYPQGIEKSSIDRMITWFETHRSGARRLYQLLQDYEPDQVPFGSSDLVEVLHLSASFLKLGGDASLTAQEFKDLILPWVPLRLVHTRQALESGARLTISFFSSFCGNRVPTDQWNGKKVGSCIESLIAHFKPSSPVFDYIVGNWSPLDNRTELSRAAKGFPIAIQSWLQNHQHPHFETIRVAQFAEALEIPAPYAFFKMTEWIPKLNKSSTEKSLDPHFFVDVGQVITHWISNTLKITEKHPDCGARGPGAWKPCTFQGTYETLDRIFNAEYAGLIQHRDLALVDKLSLYDSIGEFLIQKLAPEGSHFVGGEDLKDLITVAIRVVDSNAFAYNVMSRLKEKDFDPSTIEQSTQSMQREGLGELAALAADLIPIRDQGHRGLFKRLRAQVYDPTNEVRNHLDALGITAFMYSYDLGMALRKEYLERYGIKHRHEGHLTLVERREIVKALPQFLYDFFPRIYNDCLAWGFERTCGVVFTEVLASPLPGRTDLETYEIDLISHTSILLESMFSRCDRNGDDQIGAPAWYKYDGYREKTCILHVADALVKRLMRANILENNESTKTLLGLMSRAPVFSWAARNALTEGTIRGVRATIKAIPPFSLFAGPASMGSTLSLVAEFMDKPKVIAIETGGLGPSQDPGDELLYQGKMKSLLPSLEPAIRPTETIEDETHDETVDESIEN